MHALDIDRRVQIHMDASMSSEYAPTPALALNSPDDYLSDHQSSSRVQRTSIDVSLPGAATLQDALPEILALSKAPQIGRPWQFITAGGTVLPQHLTLHQLGIQQGQSLFLRPQRPVPPPVIRDAAEALVHTADTKANMRGGVDAIVAASLLGALLFFMGLKLNTFIPLPLLLSAVTAIALLLFWATKMQVTAIASIIGACCTTVSSTLAMQPGFAFAEQITPQKIGVSVICTCLVLFCTTAITALLGANPRIVAAWCTAASILTLASPVFWLYPHPETNPTGLWTVLSAAIVVLSVLGIVLAPMLATRISGLHIPRLPSAGGSLQVSDVPISQEKVHQQADNAHKIHEGILLGLAPACGAALLCVGWGADAFGFALCLVTAQAVVLHAHRHRSALGCWVLWIIGIIALVAAGLHSLDAHPATAVLVMCMLLGCGSAGLWVHKLSTLAPTTVVWFERFEALSVAAVFPLGCHLVGIFSALRGL